MITNEAKPPLSPETGSTASGGSAESHEKKRYRITPDGDASRAVECERPLVVMAMADKFVMCAKKVLIEEIPPNTLLIAG